MKRILIIVFAVASIAGAQETNRNSFAAFQLISQRNIFDPNREPRRPGRSRPSPSRGKVAESFSLVGTMSYDKGEFAFFDGTESDYRKILEPSGTIAGYMVAEITPSGVKLENGKQVVQMKVGSQLQRDGDAWQLVARNESPSTHAEPPAVSGADAEPAGEPAGDSPALPSNDILKKLMQQREQELK
jgi:hypothetical protein